MGQRVNRNYLKTQDVLKRQNTITIHKAKIANQNQINNILTLNQLIIVPLKNTHNTYSQILQAHNNFSILYFDNLLFIGKYWHFELFYRVHTQFKPSNLHPLSSKKTSCIITLCTLRAKHQMSEYVL